MRWAQPKRSAAVPSPKGLYKSCHGTQSSSHTGDLSHSRRAVNICNPDRQLVGENSIIKCQLVDDSSRSANSSERSQLCRKLP